MKTKLENKLQAIYTAAGYDIECDNRSCETRSINKVLALKNVEFTLVKKGYIRINKDNDKWNLRILINGKGRIFYSKSYSYEPDTILRCIIKVIEMPHVKEMVQVNEDAYICPKCHGEGHIKAFSHINNGICFDCLGLGYRFHSGNW
jgi:hypothetical protein